MINNDKDFILKLPKHLHQEYKSERRNLINKSSTEWPNDYHTAKKSEGIELDKYHTEILNACIFPFVQQSSITRKLDYAYIKSSPLSELGVKNVDFLIASKIDGALIFGETKGTLTDPKDVISEYKKRIEVINENSSYIKNMFPDIKTQEYVLGVPSDSAVETVKAIQRSDANIGGCAQSNF